jgi:hypothetical protein
MRIIHCLLLCLVHTFSYLICNNHLALLLDKHSVNCYKSLGTTWSYLKTFTINGGYTLPVCFVYYGIGKTSIINLKLSKHIKHIESFPKVSVNSFPGKFLIQMRISP